MRQHPGYRWGVDQSTKFQSAQLRKTLRAMDWIFAKGLAQCGQPRQYDHGIGERWDGRLVLGGRFESPLPGAIGLDEQRQPVLPGERGEFGEGIFIQPPKAILICFSGNDSNRTQLVGLQRSNIAWLVKNQMLILQLSLAGGQMGTCGYQHRFIKLARQGKQGGAFSPSPDESYLGSLP
jgi:hypothetical protein